MKSLLLLTTAALLSGSVLAQNAGNVLVYGSIGYASNKNTVDQNTGSSIATSTQRYHLFNSGLGVGYQLDRHWTLGISAGLMASKNRTSDTLAGVGSPIERYTSFSIGPFARYTKHFGGPFFAFGQLEAGYVGSRYTREFTGTVQRGEDYGDGLYTRLYPAFGIQVSRHTALAFSFGGIQYDYNEVEPNGGIPTNVVSTSNSSFNTTFGQQANLTVQWHFGDKARGPRRFRRMRGVRHEPMQDTRRMRDYEDDPEETDEAPAPPRRRGSRPVPPRRDRDDD